MLKDKDDTDCETRWKIPAEMRMTLCLVSFKREKSIPGATTNGCKVGFDAPVVSKNLSGNQSLDLMRKISLNEYGRLIKFI